ncbi:MAG: peptide ABC transporter substrate-binding protein [Janthinobacterium lividum]
MKPFDRPFRLTSLAIALLCQLPVSFAAVVPPGVTLAAKQELIRNNGSEIETLDPANVETVIASNVSRDLFEGLTATDGEGHVVPGVASTWEQKDRTTWIFHLRPDAKWSNGAPVVAQDFVYGCQRFVDPKTASAYAGTLGIFFVNGSDIIAGKKPPSALGVTALDAHTIEVRTPFPVPFLPELMSYGNVGPVYKPVVDKYGKDWVKPGNMVNNGAFLLSDWQVNSRLVLTRNPRYWDAANVQLTKVTYLPVEDGNTDVKLYEAGDNDLVYQLPSGTYPRYKQTYSNEMKSGPQLGIRYYDFNSRDPLLKDVRVRKALTMVIDRELLANKVLADGQRPLYGLIPQGVSGADPMTYDWAAWPMEKRVAAARALLAQAGVKPGTTLNFIYDNSEYHKKMALFAASEWHEKLGLNTTLSAMEFKVKLKVVHQGKFQIARAGWTADYNDANTFLGLVECQSPENDAFTCNPRVDALINEGNNTVDPVHRKQLLTQAAKLAMDDYPILPLVQYSLVRLVKPYVGGYSEKNPMDRYRDKDLYIIKH